MWAGIHLGYRTFSNAGSMSPDEFPDRGIVTKSLSFGSYSLSLTSLPVEFLTSVTQDETFVFSLWPQVVHCTAEKSLIQSPLSTDEDVTILGHRTRSKGVMVYDLLTSIPVFLPS